MQSKNICLVNNFGKKHNNLLHIGFNAHLDSKKSDDETTHLLGTGHYFFFLKPFLLLKNQLKRQNKPKEANANWGNLDEPILFYCSTSNSIAENFAGSLRSWTKK